MTDSGNHRIQKFDSEGNFLAKWGTRGWGTRGSGNMELDCPFGIDVAHSGDIYVVDSRNSRIKVFRQISGDAVDPVDKQSVR